MAGRFRRAIELRVPDSWYGVLLWWYYLVAVGSLGLFAVVPFVDAALLLRRASVWRLVAIYAAVDFGLWAFLFVQLRLAAGVVRGVLFVVWLLSCAVTAIVASKRLTALRRQIIAHLKETAVLGLARPYSANRMSIGDRIAKDGTGTDCALVAVGLESLSRQDNLGPLLEDAVEASGIEWASCLRTDTRDGMLVVVPKRIPKSRLVHPLLERLSASIRHNNRYADDAIRIRIRIAMHAGDIQVEHTGVIGPSAMLLTRLTEAEPISLALAEAPETATVAVIVSERFYHEVIAPGGTGIDPEFYRPVAEVNAWIHLPGHALPR